MRSRSLTRVCEDLSGEEGGVPELLCGAGRGARFGISWFFDFFADLLKREGRTMGGESRVGSGVTRI